MLSSSKGPSNEAGDVDDINAVMLLDRLVSATLSSDVIDSLQGLERGLSSKKPSSQQSSRELAQSLVLLEDSSPNNSKVLTVFWKLLHREHALVRDDPDQAQDGVLWTCRILLQLLEKETDRAAKTLLQEPAPGRILEALMDVAVADQGTSSTTDYNNNNNTTGASSLSPYVRVLALQALHKLCTLQPSLAQTQLLGAPNGLHRLGDLLQVQTDEQVRNQALLLAATLAEWPSVAQVWIFSNLAEGLMELATNGEEDGGLTNGPVLTQDCCAILHNLVTHANPLMTAELLLGSASFGQNMTALLDLRLGQQFVHPETNPNNSITNSTGTMPPSNAAEAEDDLDDLIKSASNVGKHKTTDEAIEGTGPVAVMPRLLASEETILRTILDIWFTLLQDQEQIQQMAWRQHPTVIRMIWEMALLSPPPTPQTPYPCAIPSIALQQYALHVVAQVMATVSVNQVDRDRLLYLTCTGGLGTTRQEKYEISQAALHVLRHSADIVLTTEMIAFALAPPPPEDESSEGASGAAAAVPEQAMVVPKLLSTVHQNLAIPNDTSLSSETEEDLHAVGLVGSTCALSLFLRDDVSRTMLLKLIEKQHQEQLPMDRNSDSSFSFVDQLLQRINHETELLWNEKDKSNNSLGVVAENVHGEVAVCLLRFLASWCTQAPEVVYAVLSSPHATALCNVYNHQDASSLTTAGSSASDPLSSIVLPQLAGLVLGTCLAQLQDEAQAAGWTRETLTQILTRRQMTILQQPLGNNSSTNVVDAGLPWSYSSFERTVFREWNKTTLLSARQAMVHFLTASASANQSKHKEGEGSADDHHHVSNDSLTQMVAQQTTELENLRQELAKSQSALAEKGKRRVLVGCEVPYSSSFRFLCTCFMVHRKRIEYYASPSGKHSHGIGYHGKGNHATKQRAAESNKRFGRTRPRNSVEADADARKGGNRI